MRWTRKSLATLQRVNSGPRDVIASWTLRTKTATMKMTMPVVADRGWQRRGGSLVTPLSNLVCLIHTSAVLFSNMHQHATPRQRHSLRHTKPRSRMTTRSSLTSVKMR